MTKQEFYDSNDNFYCKICNSVLPKNSFSFRNIHKDNASICKCCDWISNHPYIFYNDNFTSEEIQNAVRFIIEQHSIYVNDLAKFLDRSLDDTIDLVKSLKIGNKKCFVKVTCSCCQKEISKKIVDYEHSIHHYCSRTCYYKYKTNTVPKGSESPFYKRVHTTCSNCGSSIEVIPYDYKQTNSFGDNHNFCCRKCYWEYRSKYYVGDKSSTINIEWTPKMIEKRKRTIINNGRSAQRFDSKIQLIVNSWLDSFGIKYEREKVIGYYAMDNYLSESGLIIEVMGDYWHASPIKYNASKYSINQIQCKSLVHDKQKHTYIKNHLGVSILYLWEKDIEKRPEVCMQLILYYISHNGIISNYHSFNWKLFNNTLQLQDSIITPYQDMHADEYRHLIVS